MNVKRLARTKETPPAYENVIAAMAHEEALKDRSPLWEFGLYPTCSVATLCSSR